MNPDLNMPKLYTHLLASSHKGKNYNWEIENFYDRSILLK